MKLCVYIIHTLITRNYCVALKCFLFFKIFYLFFERESTCARGGGVEREGATEDPKQTLHRQADSRQDHVRLKPTNQKIMAWAEFWRSNNWATQAPWNIYKVPFEHVEKIEMLFWEEDLPKLGLIFLLLLCFHFPLISFVALFYLLCLFNEILDRSKWSNIGGSISTISFS